MSTYKGRVIASSLNCRKGPGTSYSVVKILRQGAEVTITSEKDNWGYIKDGWISLKYIERIHEDINYLTKAAQAADKVYNKVLELKCRHASAHSYEEMCKEKKVNCSGSASIAFQEAGILPKGKIVGHTKGTGLNGAALSKRKNTRDKAMTGYKNLNLSKCSIIRADKLYKNLPSAYKKKGCMYIYDSNAAISAGGGKIYSCNNGGSQLNSSKRYIKNKMGSGYCFTHTILYVIVPKTK